MQVAGQIFGGIAQRNAMRRRQREIEGNRRDNKYRFLKDYNMDPLQRAGNMALINRTQEAIESRNRAAAGAQAVMGGTDESLAATKAANAQALSDAASKIAIDNESRRDALKQQYEAKDEQYQSKLDDLKYQKQVAQAQAIQGMMSAAGGVASSF